MATLEEISAELAELDAEDHQEPANGKAERNGKAAHSVRPAGPQIPKQVEWFSLPEPFEEFKVKIWVTYPRRLIDDVKSGVPARQKAALRQLILSHNDWVGTDGEPLPPADSDQFWDEVPDGFVFPLIQLVQTEAGKLVASPKRR